MEAVIAEPPGHRGPASFRAPVIARRTLAHNAFELSLEKPINFTFAPGQRVRLSHGGAERDYSIASAPTEDLIRLCILRPLSVRTAGDDPGRDAYG